MKTKKEIAEELERVNVELRKQKRGTAKFKWLLATSNTLAWALGQYKIETLV